MTVDLDRSMFCEVDRPRSLLIFYNCVKSRRFFAQVGLNRARLLISREHFSEFLCELDFVLKDLFPISFPL